MGYPIYKLLRAVNRQYPNNGFINYVDVREDMYDSYEGQMIDEDLRDLINETIQEVYKDVAIDEVYSFPTVPGQNQYVLPEDCDLRDIQEVTRTYQGVRGPLCPPPGPPPMPTVYTMFFEPNGGTGVMEPMECEIGETITLPECEFEPPEGKVFDYWIINGEPEPHYHPGDEIEMQADFIASPVWKDEAYHIGIYVGNSGGWGYLHYRAVGEDEEHESIFAYGDPEFKFDVERGNSIGSVWTVLSMYADDNTDLVKDWTGITPTADTSYPVIVPTIQPIPPHVGPTISEVPAVPVVTPEDEQPLDDDTPNVEPSIEEVPVETP